MNATRVHQTNNTITTKPSFSDLKDPDTDVHAMISVPATDIYPACTSQKTEHNCPYGRKKNGCIHKNPLPWRYVQE